jgi:N-acetyl-gamma-glutamyl-phosphate reductase
MPLDDADNLRDGYFDPLGSNDTNRNDIFVFGDGEQIALFSRLDNLGKGASGSAVQNMNIMLGLDEGTTLGA